MMSSTVAFRWLRWRIVSIGAGTASRPMPANLFIAGLLTLSQPAHPSSRKVARPNPVKPGANTFCAPSSSHSLDRHSPRAALATRQSRGVQRPEPLQRVTKCRACHVKQPRHQASRGLTESNQVPRLPRETDKWEREVVRETRRDKLIERRRRRRRQSAGGRRSAADSQQKIRTPHSHSLCGEL